MRPLARTPVVWIASLSRLDIDTDRGQLAGLLTDEERERAARLRNPIDSRRFTVGRALTRLAVSSQLECSPGDVRIAVDPSGKPRLQDATSPLSFSIAHGGDLVVVALAAGAVGVDVERSDQTIALDEVMPLVCGSVESDAIRALPQAERVPRFLSLWTLKEALLKATGAGLAGDPALLVFDVTSHSTPFLVSGPVSPGPGWTFLLDDDMEGHVLALAVLGSVAPVTPVLRDAGALLAP